MAKVETRCGPIDINALGRVLVHEHVFLIDMEYMFNYRQDLFQDDIITNAAAMRCSART